MEYSAAMTSRPYLYKETKIVASLLDNRADITDIKKYISRRKYFSIRKRIQKNRNSSSNYK